MPTTSVSLFSLKTNNDLQEYLSKVLPTAERKIRGKKRKK